MRLKMKMPAVVAEYYTLTGGQEGCRRVATTQRTLYRDGAHKWMAKRRVSAALAARGANAIYRTKPRPRALQPLEMQIGYVNR